MKFTHAMGRIFFFLFYELAPSVAVLRGDCRFAGIARNWRVFNQTADPDNRTVIT